MQLTKSQLRRMQKTYPEFDHVLLEHTDEYLRCHLPTQCQNDERCTVHKRSDHSMRGFPQHYRFDCALMERICTHGVGHPDPDEFDLEVNAKGVHGCDGCCTPGLFEALNGEVKLWSCEKCGSTRRGGVFRGETQCFKCFKGEVA